MSSFSRSGGFYPNPYQGQNYYKKRGGLFRRMMGGFSGSFSGRRGMYQQGYQPQGYPQQNYAQPNYAQQQPQPNSGAASVCPKCGTSVPAGSKFCLSCGEKLNTTLFCPECGKPIPPESKFCLECGHKIR